MTRDELIEIQPSLQKLVTVDLPLDEAIAIVKLVETLNPVLMNEEIKEIEIDKVGVTISHDIKMTPSDVKFLSQIINFKEGMN